MNTVITSFNEEGYERYGKEFILTFKEFWPRSVKLQVYVESYDIKMLPKIGDDIYRNIFEVAHINDFMANIDPFPLMSGKIGDKYNIQYDARMGRKSFMLAHALKVYGGKVFWIDADTITHSKVPEDFLDLVLPDDKMCCFLGRDPYMYTESGFLGYNAAQDATRFADAVVNIFKNGTIFTQPGWHDCYAFDAVRLQVVGDHFVNLSSGLPHGTMHPFVNSVLGAYMDHRKGPRKESRSTSKDLVRPRTEPYWNVS